MPYMLGGCNIQIGNAYTLCQLFEIYDTEDETKKRRVYTLPLSNSDLKLVVLRPFNKKHDLNHSNNLLYSGINTKLCAMNEFWDLKKEKFVQEELMKIDQDFIDNELHARISKETAHVIYSEVTLKECSNIRRKNSFVFNAHAELLPKSHGRVILDKREGLLSDPHTSVLKIKEGSNYINILLHELAHLIDYEHTRSLAHGPSFVLIYRTLLIQYLKDYEYEEFYKEPLEELLKI